MEIMVIVMGLGLIVGVGIVNLIQEMAKRKNLKARKKEEGKQI
jgi:hypothetical protein